MIQDGNSNEKIESKTATRLIDAKPKGGSLFLVSEITFYASSSPGSAVDPVLSGDSIYPLWRLPG